MWIRVDEKEQKRPILFIHLSLFESLEMEAVRQVQPSLAAAAAVVKCSQRPTGDDYGHGMKGDLW